MTSTVIAMILILALAAGVVGLVAVGIKGRWRDRAPKLAHRLARAAQHLNGDGTPPERWMHGFERAGRRLGRTA